MLAVYFYRESARDMREAAQRVSFVNQVSHELRTPLTQIRLFAETLLLGRARTAEDERRALEIIDRESHRLARLVDRQNQLASSEGIEALIEGFGASSGREKQVL